MKKLVVSLLLLPLILILAAVIFVLTIDPTRLAPLIQEQLANQGIDAQFKGKISWQFYPDIGLSVSELELRSLNSALSEQSDFPELAQIGTVRFTVELKPLFSRQIRVQGITLENTQVNLFVNASGQSNWELPPGDPAQKPESTPAPTAGKPPELSVKTLEIRNLNFVYDDRSSDTVAKVNNFNLSASDVNIDGKAFPVSTDFALDATPLPPLGIDTSVNIGFDQHSGVLALTNLLARLNGKNLDTVQLSGALSYTPNAALGQILADLQINHLNLDQLLALSGSEEETDPSPSEPSELPMEMLRQLESSAKVRVDQLSGFDLSAQNFIFETAAKDGYIDIKNLNADLFNGQLRSSGYLDARGTQAKFLLQGKAEGIDVGKLLKQFADNDSLAGATNTEFSLQTAGSTVDDLINSISADAVTQAKSLVLQPLNLEKQYCKLVSLLNKESAAAQLLNNATWQAFTELEPVEVKIHYAQNQVNMESLSARVSSLLTSAQGSFNLQTGKFDFPISLSLQALGDEQISCMDISKKWLNRALPLRCKGELGKLGIDTCLPDTNLIKDILEQKYKGELDAKLEAEKAELKQKADEEKARARAKLEEEKQRAEEKAKKKLDDKLKKLIDKN